MTKKIQNQSKAVRRSPVLQFSPTAWAKLLCMRDVGDTEIGGFGITPADDLLFVEDLRLVRQSCTAVHVAFDDAAVADFFDEMVDIGRRPEEFARIWIHTHPGSSPQPSNTDEATFERVFGRSDWAVMFIIACGGQSYARLRYNVGPGADMELPVEVDYSRPFQGTNLVLWQEEYVANVQVPSSDPLKKALATDEQAIREQEFLGDWWRDAWSEYLMDFERPHHENQTYGFISDF